MAHKRRQVLLPTIVSEAVLFADILQQELWPRHEPDPASNDHQNPAPGTAPEADLPLNWTQRLRPRQTSDTCIVENNNIKNMNM